jgi:regulator of protease activity HflC (stomatin/prohibitin superfamily)
VTEGGTVSIWFVLIGVVVPLLVILAIIANSDSIIKIPPGQVGLLLVHGRATDTVIEPGIHWVPRLRKRMVAAYPSLELSYRSLLDGEPGQESGSLERTGPALRVTLGDRTQATLGYTVRFRLDESRLRMVHERFGADGIWTAVRDISGRAVRMRLGGSDVGIDQLMGSALTTLEQEIGTSVGETLGEDGMIVTMFAIGDIELGRTGAVIQSTVRARLELEREEAEAAVRTARARIDAELEPYLASVPEAALRYREVDVWRDLVHARPDRVIPVPGRPATAMAAAELEAAQEAASAEQAEQA